MNRRDGLRLLRFALLGCAALAWLTPLAVVVLTAFRSQRDLIAHGVFSPGGALQLGNFAEAWRIGHFGNLFRNSTGMTDFIEKSNGRGKCAFCNEPATDGPYCSSCDKILADNR